MSFFETKTALGTPSSNSDVAIEAVLISLIAVLAKQSDNANTFIWDIENEVNARLSPENEVNARLSPENRSSSLEIAQEILSAVREKALK